MDSNNISSAWYHGSREDFLATRRDEISNQLVARATDECLEIEPEQNEEWRRSVEVLQQHLDERIPILRAALTEPGCEAIRDVILEFDFRRRGLRMDCLLVADGVLFVVEFKRSKIERADRDQAMNYAINLIEFHKVTREWCENDNANIVPILALTEGNASSEPIWPGLSVDSWSSLASKPLECNNRTLRDALQIGLKHRRSRKGIPRLTWLNSPFKPSSSILDATLSLYGNHDVVAIQEHAAPKEAIDQSTEEIRNSIDRAFANGEYHIIFLSGAPGAGKTLVGLDLVMRGRHAASATFVTGNAPLVEVLNEALRQSYVAQGKRPSAWASTGYRRTDAKFVSSAATFKVAKAHNFLGKRGTTHQNEDGRLLVFDEAQRTYEKGRVVLGEKLADHEAALILETQSESFPTGGAVVVALIGHNQAINRGERGLVAWLEAADRYGWKYSIADETIALSEFNERDKWRNNPLRLPLKHGHLNQSIRYYRNSKIEEWVSAVLNNEVTAAVAHAEHLRSENNTVWLTRSLATARRWAKLQSFGGQRAGIIASGQARRLAAEGLFVDHKPDIAKWMLAPSSDVRSSNALETVQNQYQIQGLELDYCIVCWDADLRRERDQWAAYKLSGSDWNKDKLLDIAKNGYRVILTRARKGMIIFLPTGDASGDDPTRNPEFYDGVARYLIACGVKILPL
jgi:hypothetical protein